MANDSSQGHLQFLTDMLNGMESKYLDVPAWEDSPFKWVLSQPSARKGAIGRDLIMFWSLFFGVPLRPAGKNHQPYLTLDDIRIQVKFSTLWENGSYRFQQIPSQGYDYCLCFGLAPHDMNAWLISKEILDTHVIGRQGQHTGSTSSETWWFEASPINPASWLQNCGGELADVAEQLKLLESAPGRSDD